MTPKFRFEISWPLLVSEGSVKSSFSNKYYVSIFFLSITGCFFTLARSILLVDVPSICHEKIWKVTQVTLAVVFGIIAVGSLIPALFGSLIWKVGQLVFEDDDWISTFFDLKILFFWIGLQIFYHLVNLLVTTQTFNVPKYCSIMLTNWM